MVLGRMVAQAEFATTDINVQPGDVEQLSLTLVNLGNRTETFTLIPAGLLAGWVRIEPPTVTLFGGSREEITVTLRPPKLATTPAGPAPLTVRIIPQDDPDDVVIAETTANLGMFHDRRVHLLQPVVRSRRRAVFEFLVENQGNSQASCRLHLIDTTRRLDGDFDPPAVGVEPAGNSLVRLKLKALRRHWRRGSRTLEFSIEADQQGYPTAEANATFVQTPFLPDKIGWKVLGLAAVIGLLAAAWFALLKPLTERTARDAVDAPATTTIASTVPGDTAPPTQSTQPPDGPDNTAPVATPAEPVGRPFTKLFSVTAARGTVGEDFFVVPEGQELRVSTIILQNTNQDAGIAKLFKNDDTLYQWNLELALDNVDPLPLGSPVVFEAGSTVLFQVTCDVAGSDSLTATCGIGLFMNGALFAA